MEERVNNIILSVQIGSFIEMLKSLPLTVEYVQDNNMIFARAKEFRGSGYGEAKDICNSLLVRDMKDWAEAFASDFENWKKGREHEIPYLLKILLSSEQELLSCLN